MGSANPQSRKWLLTINNPEKYALNHESVKDILHLFNPDYFCLVDEIGNLAQNICTSLFIQSLQFVFQH